MPNRVMKWSLGKTMFRLFGYAPWRRQNRRSSIDARRRPVIEMLEERWAPAVYTVDRLGDAGNGAANAGDLRYVLTQLSMSQDANNTIGFANGVTGSINLASALP